MFIGFFKRLFAKGFTLRGITRLGSLVAALILIWSISYDTFEYNNPFYTNPTSSAIQFWVCIFFLLDISLDFILSHHKKRYFLTYALMFIACIPYLSFLPYTGWNLPKEVVYIVKFLPLIRSTYALAIVISWFTFSRTATVFITYIVVMFISIYLGSLIFYVFEVDVNPGVKTYSDALWWATMEAVTVGCNIEAVTPVGKVLSVLIAVLGMLILPMFTVYVTNIIGTVQKVANLMSGRTEMEDEETLKDKDKTKAADKPAQK